MAHSSVPRWHLGGLRTHHSYFRDSGQVMGFQERGSPHSCFLGAQMLRSEMALSPVDARRPVLTSLSPSAGACHSGLKPTGSGPTVAIAAAATAVVSVDPEGLGGPSPSRVQPCHLLTLAPIRMPLRTAAFPGKYPARSLRAVGWRESTAWQPRWGPAGLQVHGFLGSGAGSTGEGFPGVLILRPHSWTSVPLTKAAWVSGSTWAFPAVKQSSGFHLKKRGKPLLTLHGECCT